MWRRVGLVCSYVFEEPVTSIFGAERISEVGTLAVTSNLLVAPNLLIPPSKDISYSITLALTSSCVYFVIYRS
jgi:hypothetical protein